MCFSYFQHAQITPNFFDHFKVWKKRFQIDSPQQFQPREHEIVWPAPLPLSVHMSRSLSLSLRAVKHESVFYYNICVKESVFSNKFWNKLCSLKNFIYANRLIWIQYSWFSLLGNNLFPKIVKENKETVVREQASTKGFTTFFLVQRSMHWHFFKIQI